LLIATGFSFQPIIDEYLVKYIDTLKNKLIRDQQITLLFQHQIPQIQVLLQFLGRAVRSEQDKGALVIIDSRNYEFLRNELKIRLVDDIDILISRLHQHYN